MSNETQNLLEQVRIGIHDDQHAAISRARIGIGVRIVLIAFVSIYMSWMLGALSRLDAEEITRLAAISIEERLPDFRAELRDYAIEMAPELTDHGQQLLLQLPGRAGQYLETRLLDQTDAVLARLENDVDLALGTVIEDQLQLVTREFPGATPEEQIDTIVFGFSDVLRHTMIAAIDEMYIDYSGGVRALDDRLEHLRRDVDLTESEKIDRELIEAWMVLVHRHGVTSPDRVADALQARY